MTCCMAISPGDALAYSACLLPSASAADNELRVGSLMLSLHAVSQATLLLGSSLKHASSTASDTWSQSLSGCPSFTDSEEKRKVRSVIAFLTDMASMVTVPEVIKDASKAKTKILSPSGCP